MVVVTTSGKELVSRVSATPDGTRLRLTDPLVLQRVENGNANSSTVLTPLNQFGTSREIDIDGRQVFFADLAEESLRSYYEVSLKYLRRIWLPSLRNATNVASTTLERVLRESSPEPVYQQKMDVEDRFLSPSSNTIH